MHLVAIPSNRVNVSYWVYHLAKKKAMITMRRNPLKSGQCFLLKQFYDISQNDPVFRRNPLKSGQCFLHLVLVRLGYHGRRKSRNPLKSGQCFLQTN